jgi:hypothetical protein
MKIRWPRGRFNGRRIVGLTGKVSIDLSWWNWRPCIAWNHGNPYLLWLCLQLRGEAVYHFED